ncbi:MAG: DUF1559 domain-containing protein [Planctomycetes bacterium]|nr:DUF1559 domain-containing protein [Planctomycetota bacterium]
MRICPQCDTSIPGNRAYCPECGSRLAHTSRAGATGRSPQQESQRDPEPRRRSSRKKPSANTWLIVSLAVIGGIIVVAGMGFLVWKFFPENAIESPFGRAREAARRAACKNNLKQIGIALHNYHDVYKSFPPAYVVDDEGRPLYSWRVLILPFLEEIPLFRRFDLTKAWDDPHNKKLLAEMPKIFRCPSDTDANSTTTSYAGVFGRNCVFRGPQPTRFRDITDGTSSTVMVGEASGAKIPWTKPADIDTDLQRGLNDSNGFQGPHKGGCYFVFGDGSVQFIPNETDKAELQKLFNCRDGKELKPRR